MTNQLSKKTRGQLYSIALEIGGRPGYDSIIQHALDVQTRLKTLVKLAYERDEKCITLADAEAILQ